MDDWIRTIGVLRKPLPFDAFSEDATRMWCHPAMTWGKNVGWFQGGSSCSLEKNDVSSLIINHWIGLRENLQEKI